MAYTHYAPTKPDPSTDNGTQAFTNTRTNLQALRDGLIPGLFSGWDVTLSAGAADKPTTVTMSDGGTERLRLTITYGSAGATLDKITNVVVDYSSNSGGSWDSVDSTAISYDGSGNITAAPGMAVALLPFLQNVLYLLRTHENLTNPHSATSAATANRLMIRDANGRAAVATPSASGDIATKGYVDGATVANATEWAGAAQTVSTSAPSGGADGDIWFKYTP